MSGRPAEPTDSGPTPGVSPARKHRCQHCKAQRVEIDTPQIRTEHWCRRCQAFRPFKRLDHVG